MSEELYPRLRGKMDPEHPKARYGNKLYTLEQIRRGNWDYGRYVKTGYVVFDFDKEPYVSIIEQIINDKKLKCAKLITDRGSHYKFKTNVDKIMDTSHSFNWIGLEFDVKGKGLKQDRKECYQVMRLFGKERTEIYMNGAECDEDLDYAPKWLYLASAKRQIDLTVDQEGGRNSMFHGEMMIEAKRFGFTYEEYVEMAHVINYEVLPKGLDEKELETAIREEEWDKLDIGPDSTKEQLKSPYVIAQEIIDELGIVYDGSTKTVLCIDKNNIYQICDDSYIKRVIAIRYNCEGLTPELVNRVVRALYEIIDVYVESTNVIGGDEVMKYNVSPTIDYIVCNDKVINVNDGSIHEPSRTIITKVKYGYRYMSKTEWDAYYANKDNLICKVFDQITSGDWSGSSSDKKLDKTTRRALWQAFGCMVVPKANSEHMIILKGETNDGKSLLTSLIGQVMTRKYCAFGKINELGKDFGLETVYNKICFIDDDAEEKVYGTQKLKTYIKGNAEATINIKGIPKFQASMNVQIVMNTNYYTKFDDMSESWLNRIFTIPFRLHINDSDPRKDTTLFDRISNDYEAMSWLLSGALYGYQDFVENGRQFCKVESDEGFMSSDLEKEDLIKANRSSFDIFFDEMLNDDFEKYCQTHDVMDVVDILTNERKKCLLLFKGKSTSDVTNRWAAWIGKEGGHVLSRSEVVKLGIDMRNKLNKVTGLTWTTVTKNNNRTYDLVD